jgi:hypothetical protein
MTEQKADRDRADRHGERMTPPYGPYRTFRNYIDGLRINMPQRIDRSVLGTLSGAAQSQLIGALRYFDFIKPDGTPTDKLRRFIAADKPEQERMLREIIRGAYPFLFTEAIDLQRATPAILNDAFAKAGASGDTVRKAGVFFLFISKDAAMPLSPFLKLPRLGKGITRRRARGNGDVTPQANRPLAAPIYSGTPEPQTPYDMLIEILDPDSMDEEEQKAVWTLIRYLKKQEAESVE